MIKKIIAAGIALIFVLSVIGLAFAGDEKSAAQAPQLAAMLPESDGIMTVDVQRVFNQMLPQILSANQPKLDKMMAKVEEVKNKTGIDLRRFEQVAVGVKTRPGAGGNMDFEPVILARGTYDSNHLVEFAKLAAKGDYRTEKLGDRTIYIFSPKNMIDENKPKSDNSFFGKIINKIFINLDKEFALTSYDRNTLAFGSVARVREVIEAKTRVNDQLLNLVYRDQNAVMSFGANMPSDLSGVLDLGNEEIDKNIDVIKQLYGTLDVNGNSTTLSVTARALKNNQAEDLKIFLSGMAEVGKTLLGSSKGEDKKVYVRMIKNARISRTGNEVMFDLQVPQSDIDVLLGEKK
ncbi:MAG: hypothetical protein R2747_15940 [Pyrinomonadaceae bacterium]